MTLHSHGEVVFLPEKMRKYVFKLHKFPFIFRYILHTNAKPAYMHSWQLSLEDALTYVCKKIKFILRKPWFKDLKDPLHSLKIREMSVKMLCLV